MLVEFLIIERSKFRSQSAKRPDESELGRDLVDDETEPNLLREPEVILSFTLHINQLISCGQHVLNQVVAAIGCKGDVPHFTCGMECPANEIAAGPYVLRPWQDDISKRHIRPGLKTLQSTVFDQIITELTETESGLIVAETRSSYDGEPDITEARRVAITMFEAEINHSTNDKRIQVLVGKMCRRDDFSEDLHGIKDVGVGHQGQVNELLDPSASKLRPDTIIFSHYFLTGRVRRPLGAAAAEVFQTYLHGAVAPIQRCVEGET